MSFSLLYLTVKRLFESAFEKEKIICQKLVFFQRYLEKVSVMWHRMDGEYMSLKEI